MLPSQTERELYSDVWSSVDDYGRMSPGAIHVPMFQEIARPQDGATILDAGCGSGAGAVALAKCGYRVAMCDVTGDGLTDEAKAAAIFTTACLWNRDQMTPFALTRANPAMISGRFNHVYCCDVMEHVPTEFTMLVLDRLVSLAWGGVFLSIALVPDNFGVWVGQPLHQTVRPFEWWRDRLREIGHMQEARDLLDVGIYYVSPRY